MTEETKDTEQLILTQYDQSLYIGNRAAKISLTAYLVEERKKPNESDDTEESKPALSDMLKEPATVYHLTINPYIGDPIKIVVDREDLYRTSSMMRESISIL